VHFVDNVRLFLSFSLILLLIERRRTGKLRSHSYAELLLTAYTHTPIYVSKHNGLGSSFNGKRTLFFFGIQLNCFFFFFRNHLFHNGMEMQLLHGFTNQILVHTKKSFEVNNTE